MPPLPLTDSLPDLELVYLDAHLLVVHKPSGLLSVPGRGEDKQDCLASRVAFHVPDALIVHRLDMATSGLMLFARGKEMQKILNLAFAERRVQKGYVAVVNGSPSSEHGEINLPLLTDWPRRPLQKVDHVLGKPALTRFRVLTRHPAGCTARVALEPVTGRTHQLRVHLWAHGHPILGDALYAPPAVRDLSQRLLLHAQSLALSHPVSGVPLEFTQDAPF